MTIVRASALAGILLLSSGALSHAQTAPAAGTEAQQGDSDIEGRVQQLEEQLLDMQVQTSTLRSLAKGDSGSDGLRTTSGADGDMEERVRGIESGMQTLSGQIQQLARQLKALETRIGSRGLQTNGLAVAPGAEEGAEVAGQASADVAGDGFGQTTVDSEDGQGLAGAIATEAPANQDGDVIADQLASVDDGSGDPNAAYEEAYGFMLQQDYASAEHAFTEFLARHSKSKLAGNARYWLGESYYVRGQYKQAADSFLKGYKGHRQSQKAPDSLLKLSMSLARLGEQKAACAGFARLDTEFPNASAQVKGRAASERQKAGC